MCTTTRGGEAIGPDAHLKTPNFHESNIADLQENGGCRMVAIIQQGTWTDGNARNLVSSLHSLLMQLWALETHIRISRNLEKFVDLMTSRRSGPKPSPCPLQAQASVPNISGNLIVGCNGSARPLQDTLIGLQDYWRQLSANSTIVACRTANPTSFPCCVVGSACLLSATAIFWRLAIL